VRPHYNRVKRMNFPYAFYQGSATERQPHAIALTVLIAVALSIML
jgi:hypothetical protein